MPEGDDVRVVFVCWGNICRSPMAERVAERMAADEQLSGVRFSSAATSREELGAPIDPRAIRVLDRHGYRSDLHAAHRITAEEINDADLVVAMEDIHVTKMAGLVPEAQQRGAAHRLRPEGRAGIRGARPVVRLCGRASKTPWPPSRPPCPAILDRVRELQSR